MYFLLKHTHNISSYLQILYWFGNPLWSWYKNIKMAEFLTLKDIISHSLLPKLWDHCSRGCESYEPEMGNSKKIIFIFPELTEQLLKWTLSICDTVHGKNIRPYNNPEKFTAQMIEKVKKSHTYLRSYCRQLIMAWEWESVLFRLPMLYWIGIQKRR